MTAPRIAVFLMLLFAAAPLPAGWAQENSKTQEKLVRDQQMIRMRLQRIEEMMSRLMQKYRDEGGQRNADLILKAREELRQRDVFNRIDEVEELIRERRLQVVEKQKELSRDLEDIFAILQDRSDLERLEDVLNTFTEGLAKTSELIDEQEQLLEETRKLAHSPEELLKEALDKVRTLREKQANVRAATKEAARSAEQAEQYLRLAGDLEDLAEREDVLADKTARALRDRLGEAAARVGEARRDQEALAERLEREAEESGQGDPSAKDAAAAMNDLLRRQIAVNEALRESAAALAGEEGREKTAAALKKVDETLKRVEKALEEGKPADAAREARAAAEALRSLEKEMGRGGDGRLAPEQAEIEKALDGAIGAMEALPEGRDQSAAAEKAGQARESMRDAVRSLEEGSDAAALESEEEAARRLREAAEQLRRAWEKEAGQRRDETNRLAGEQDALARETRSLEDLLESAESILESEEGLSSEKQTTSSTAGEMTRAGDQLRSGSPQTAGEPQERAETGLESLEQSLEERAQQAAEEGGRETTPEEEAEKYKDLAQRQKDLEERTRDLMDRLRDLPSRKPQASLSDAADNMSSASSELENEQGENAEQDQEDAKKQLEKALQDMLQERNKYQQIQQQEVLFRVKQELEEIKEEQDAVNTATADFDLERQGESTLRRSQKRALRELAQREEAVRDRTAVVKEKIAEDGSTVFTWILDRNMDDLEEVVDALEGYRTGEMVRVVQKDVTRRFDELIAALQEELKRRMDAPQSEPQQTPPQNAKPPLIPPVAELIMIKTMEESALRRLEEFVALNPEIEGSGASPLHRELLKRMALEHMSITDLFTEILEREAAAAQGGEGE